MFLDLAQVSQPGKHCNYPVIKHGRLYHSYRGHFPARVNQQFLYNCDQYFVPPSQYSSDYLTCTAEGWSAEEPCLRDCIFNNLENGYTPSSERKAVQGETVRVRCYHGYSLQNNQNTMTCTESGWSPPPRCIRVIRKVKSCAPPPQLLNGKGKEIHKEEYAHNEVVEYACNPRFLMKGSHKIQCVDGEWTALPVCIEEERICGNIPDIDHSDIKPSVPPYHHGDSVEFSCREAFTMVGPRFIMCIIGAWTQPPQCIATDELRKCKGSTLFPSEGKPAHMIEYDHSTNKIYQCRGKSEHKHSICINGEWDPKVDCKEEAQIQPCPPPPQVPNAHDMTTTVKYQDGEKYQFYVKKII